MYISIHSLLLNIFFKHLWHQLQRLKSFWVLGQTNFPVLSALYCARSTCCAIARTNAERTVRKYDACPDPRHVQQRQHLKE